jgi:hypothetical protein
MFCEVLEKFAMAKNAEKFAMARMLKYLPWQNAENFVMANCSCHGKLA